MKCSGVPFTHIYKWKRCSSSRSSSGSSGCVVVVVIVVVGSASMICFPLLCFESKFESGSDSFYLCSTTNDCFEEHLLVLSQGLLWNSHHFPMSFLEFLLPFLSWTGYLKVGLGLDLLRLAFLSLSFIL
jgi:hypothetical protein